MVRGRSRRKWWNHWTLLDVLVAERISWVPSLSLRRGTRLHSWAVLWIDPTNHEVLPFEFMHFFVFGCSTNAPVGIDSARFGLIWLMVRIYPAAWRGEFGAEFEDLLRRWPLSVPVIVNVVVGG